MAQRKSTKKPAARKRKTTRRKKKGFWGKVGAFCSSKKLNIIGLIFLIVAVLSFFNLGVAGTLFANALRLLVGNAYQVLAVLLGVFGVVNLLGFKLPKLDYHYVGGFLIAFLGWVLDLSIQFSNALNQHVDFIKLTFKALENDFGNGVATSNVGGGMIGAALMQLFSFLVSETGTVVLAFLLMIIGVLVFLNIPVIRWFKQFCVWIGQTSVDVFNQFKTWKSKRHEAKEARKEAERAQQAAEAAMSAADNTEKQEEDDKLPGFEAKSVEKDVNADSHTSQPHITVASDRLKQSLGKPKETAMPVSNGNNSSSKDYQLPPATLLTKVPETDQSKEYNDISKNTKILESTLKSFGVDAQIKNVSLGPSVTEYELHPAIGVKVSKIVNLSDDIALALAAKDIRIEAPIPGKSLIGIEVPNREVSTVSFRDVFENQTESKKNVLSVPLGKDVNGKVISCDITKMPHLLIAGSTGSGKSVAINAILTSILLKATPDQVKFMLIDPKRVELGVYNGIPHLLSPVVSDPKKAARALHKVVEEMENRYELFAKSGQRNLKGYNEFIQKMNKKDGTHLPTLPYIVVVVDELADLMMTVSNEVESAIIRLAQMGRAAGVHMILATQRPSVDVITGLIKANVPSRIAFAVSSGIDSRTILDTNGAEKLLGRGDMLYLPIEQNTPTRIQGSFISDQDVESVVDFVKNEAEPEYDEAMMVSDADIETDEANDDQDDLFDEALEFVVKGQKASTSMIQRRFRIGYNRAARIIDDMEQRGYVGAQHGSKPREVFKKTDSSDENQP